MTKPIIPTRTSINANQIHCSASAIPHASIVMHALHILPDNFINTKPSLEEIDVANRLQKVVLSPTHEELLREQ